MTERRQERWFLTRQAVNLLYAHDHQHPSSRETARAALPSGYGTVPPADFAGSFALDHEHLPHLEHLAHSPFVDGRSTASDDEHGVDHEHPPWTATSRGVEMALRGLTMLEPIYRLVPELPISGELR